MRVTIIPDDGFVRVDARSLLGVEYDIDPAIHAVQWYGEEGEIEYRVDGQGNKAPNERFTDLSRFQSILDAFEAAKPQPRPEPTLDEVKAAKWTATKLERALTEEGGFGYMGKMVASDFESRQHMFAAAQVAQASIVEGREWSVQWLCKDNSALDLDARQFLGMIAALWDHIAEQYRRAQGVRALIDSARSREEVEGIGNK